MKTIKLNKPDMSRKTTTLMQAFQQRQATREYAGRELSLQDLSDLCWAACGVNRPDGRRTSPTARNRQEIELYVLKKDGAYIYEPAAHELRQVSAEDMRKHLAASQEYVLQAPVSLLIVSNLTKTESSGERNLIMTSCDAGIVSQNISLFCSGAGLATVPRGIMSNEALAKALGLDDKYIFVLNHPVGYFK